MKDTIKITGGGYVAEIGRRGATCLSLRHTFFGADIIRSPKQENEKEAFLFGVPVLFPPNRIEDGRFGFEGRSYMLPVTDPISNCSLHGDLNEKEFSVIKQTDKEVVLEFICSDAQRYMQCFHDFSIRIGYRLGRFGLRQCVDIKNLADNNMPLMLGFHTAFRLPFLNNSKIENIRVRAEIESEEIERNERHLPTGRYIKNKYLEDIKAGELQPDKNYSIHCKAAGSGKMYLTDKQRNMCVVYKPDRAFEYRVFFKNGKDFICLEPQTCKINACNTEDGISFLLPRKERKFISYIGLEKR